MNIFFMGLGFDSSEQKSTLGYMANIFLNIQVMTDQFAGNNICFVNIIGNLIKTEKNCPLLKNIV